MGDKIQNVRIKYIVDSSDILDAKKAFQSLTKDEKDLKTAFDETNKAAVKQEQAIDNLGNSFKGAGQKAEQSANSLTGLVKKIGPAIASAFAISELISFQKKIIDITATFQKYEAVLTNTLGDNSRAKKALRDIQDFAAKTPFSVNELTDSFVKLANQGFVPTTNQLRQLGDLASSTGKSFDQLAEAILDAQSGQFERLKEFGIKASKSGDQVAFTFKGIKTTVDNSSASIQKYILSLGDLKGVSGSMAAISGTLEGQLSNLGDTFDSLLLAIGRRESDGLSGGITFVNAALAEMTKAVNGQNSVFDRLIFLVKALTEPFVDLFTTLYKVAESMGIVSGKGSIIEGVFFVIEKAVKVATLPLRFFIQQVVTLIDLVSLNFEKVGQDFKKLGEIITLTDGQEGDALERSIKLIKEKMDNDRIAAEDAAKLKDESAAKEKELTEKQLKEIEKRFKAELDYIGKKEALALREAKLLGATQEDLINIERSYNNQRIQVFKNYGRARGVEYQSLLLKEKEYLNEILVANKEAELAVVKEKLEAEQKSLDAAAKTRAERIKRIREEGQIRADELKKQHDKEVEEEKKAADQKLAIRKEAEQKAVNLISEIGNGLFQIEQARLSSKLTELEKQKQQELALHGTSEQSKAAINKKFADEEAKIKRKQAVAQREEAIFNLTLQNAQNIVKYIGGLPATAPLLALAVATYGIQLGVLLAKPLPKFNRGVERLTGEGSETSDSILARLSVGERVVTAKDNRDYYPTLSAIHNHKIPASAINSFAMDYGSMRKPIALRDITDSNYGDKLDAINKTLKNLPVAQVHMDKKGLRTFLKSGDSETEFLNNYFKN